MVLVAVERWWVGFVVAKPLNSLRQQFTRCKAAKQTSTCSAFNKRCHNPHGPHLRRRTTMADFNLQEEVIALQDEASYHIANDVVDGADAGEVRAVLDGEFI